MRLIQALGTALLFSSCLPRTDPGSLTALSDRPPAAMECSACHPYALLDPDHVFHLMVSPLYLKTVNGTVTCLECHRKSIRYTTAILYDSIYRDSIGVERSTLDFASSRALIPGTLSRVDTLIQHHPIPSGRETDSANGMREWITGLAHMNGRVDVDFDSAVTNLARFQGARASYNPKLETCSAVSCHGRDGPYRFQACRKGLPELKGYTESLSPCE